MSEMKWLKRAREQAVYIRYLSNRYTSLDGTEKELLGARLLKERRIMDALEGKARREMEGMPPELCAFSALYYLEGMSIRETAEAIDRSIRQCMRYKRMIERRRREEG